MGWTEIIDGYDGDYKSNCTTLVGDYPIYLIDPRSLADDELKKFHSSLREVMGCIKYSNDKDKLAAFISHNPRMNMEVEAARSHKKQSIMCQSAGERS